VDAAECHATGTAVGDVIELEAVGSLFGDFFDGKRPLRVASVKSNIGHAEVAAGMFSCHKVHRIIRRDAAYGVRLMPCCRIPHGRLSR
jgi:acyl transferase domain-containing protein